MVDLQWNSGGSSIALYFCLPDQYAGGHPPLEPPDKSGLESARCCFNSTITAKLPPGISANEFPETIFTLAGTAFGAAAGKFTPTAAIPAKFPEFAAAR